MLGLILVPLILGALVSSIWGKEAAQGCFKNVGRLLMWGIVAVAVVLVPPFGVVLACGYALYLLVRHGGRFLEGCYDAQREMESDRTKAERLKQHQAELARKGAVEAAASADPSSPPGGLIAPRCYRPRKGATTAMPSAPADAEYWAVPVKDAYRQGYVVEERTSGCSVFLGVAEFGRDWTPCHPTLKPRPKSAPVEERPPAPTWTTPAQRARTKP